MQDVCTAPESESCRPCVTVKVDLRLTHAALCTESVLLWTWLLKLLSDGVGVSEMNQKRNCDFCKNRKKICIFKCPWKLSIPIFNPIRALNQVRHILDFIDHAHKYYHNNNASVVHVNLHPTCSSIFNALDHPILDVADLSDSIGPGYCARQTFAKLIIIKASRSFLW